MKLKQYSKRQSCYYCGAPGPSKREHTPPKMMFAGFDCDSITIPSCDKHNTDKSIGDRAVITSIIMSASQMYKNELSTDLTANVITAIELAEPDFYQAKNEVELREFIIDPPEGFNIPLPYTKSSASVYRWIRQLTSALVWSATGVYEPSIDWDNVPVTSPEFVESPVSITFNKATSILQKNHETKQQLDKLPWRHGWSAYPKEYPPDIYSFDLCFPNYIKNSKDNDIIFRHRFYNSTSVWYALFNAPLEIANNLILASS